MKVARFIVQVDANWRVRVLQASDGAVIAPERAMSRVSAPKVGDLPFPPEPIAPTEPHAALAADATGGLAASLYGRVVGRDLDPGDVARYGRWLFDALLGDETFAKIRAAAVAVAAPGPAIAELALAWPRSEHALSRLHWEAMRSRDGFLAAGHGVRVAVTRLVAGATQTPRPMASPPRVLFAVGGAVGDEALRPGAELLSVLRPLRVGERTLRGEVVACATETRLRAAVRRVSPDVVHLVAHGVVDEGACLVQLATDEGESSGLRSADQLFAMLGDGGTTPTVLLLSACDAGLALPLAQAGSLASQLVAGGVPIVVGMAGRVANAACRLFARRFGEALLAGEPIVAATEEGRRAAFSAGEPPDRSIDWALPALFLAEGVAPDFGTARAPEDPAHTRLAAYNVSEPPVFCGRHELVEALHDIAARKAHPVLAIWSKGSGLGRTRALKELTAEALRAGHVPCLLRWESPTAVVPTSLEAFARQLGAAIMAVRGLFNVPRVPPHAASPLALLLTTPLDALRTDPRLPAALSGHLAFAEALDARAFALAIADELTALAQGARAANPALPPSSRAIVLVDDVHRLDKALEALLGGLITAFGLGAEGEPVPVVVSFALDAPAQTPLRPIAEGQRPDWRRVHLDRFGDGEALLAYQEVLLHPFGDVLPPFSSQRWAFDFDADKDVVEESVAGLQEVLAGTPGRLGKREFYVAARMAKAARFVVPAGDEDVLEALRKVRA